MRSPAFSPHFSGHLWINLSTDNRPLPQRLEESLKIWQTSLKKDSCPALEEEVIREERSKGTLEDLKAVLKETWQVFEKVIPKRPRISTNGNKTQAHIDYGNNENFRAALKRALREREILYYDTEKTFHCNLRMRNTPVANPFGSLEGRVGKLLLDNKLSITTAESCTGGLIASRLTDVKASGNFIKYADVVYCNEAKREALGVSKEFLDREGPYNAETARWMAEGSRGRSGADVSISITGLAGLYPDNGVPAGTAYVGIAGLTPETKVFQVNLPADIPKERKKHLFSEYALFRLEQLLKLYKPASK